MLGLVGGTKIIGEDIICPMGKPITAPEYTMEIAGGYVPITLQYSVEGPITINNISGNTVFVGENNQIPSLDTPLDIKCVGNNGVIDFIVGDLDGESKPQQFSINVPHRLSSILAGKYYYTDRIFPRHGKIFKDVGIIDCSSLDFVRGHESLPGFFVAQLSDPYIPKKENRAGIVSNRFVYSDNEYEDKVGSAHINREKQLLVYLPTTIETNEQCKQWFLDNPTEIFYGLEESVETDIPVEMMETLSNIKAYNGNTFINAYGEEGEPELEIEMYYPRRKE